MSRRQGLLGLLFGLFGSDLQSRTDDGLSETAKPQTLREAIPESVSDTIKDGPAGPGIPGLYLSSYLNWHRLLVLSRNGRFRLIHWKIDHRTHERSDLREYTGRYAIEKTDLRDDLVILDFGSQPFVSGSDGNDHSLLFMKSGGNRYLLRPFAFDHTAFEIRENGRLGRSEDYLFDVKLSDPFGEEPFDGREAPPLVDLPNALAALVSAEPLVMSIIDVDELTEPAEFEENRQVMCTLSLGEQDGLYMNMPLYSPDDSDKKLKGWVWQMHPTNCRAGIEYEIDAHDRITSMPEVGDVLTSKAPEGF